MDNLEQSEENFKNFVKSVTHRRLLYYWMLRSKGCQISNEEIWKLEAEVYPDLKEFDNAIEHLLSQKDLDELQLLLSLVEEQLIIGNSFTKATIFRLFDIKVKMWKEDNHQRPHFHIEYKKQYNASYAVDTLERLAGDMPLKYEKVVMEWAKSNESYLLLTWNKLQTGKDINELVGLANTI